MEAQSLLRRQRLLPRSGVGGVCLAGLFQQIPAWPATGKM
jgi:hypothetical protein